MALVNPNIALSFKPVEIQQRNPLAEAAQVMNLQQAQMQMEKIRQTDAAMERIRQVAMQHGGPDNLTDIAKAYMGSPDAQHQALGLTLLQKQQEKAGFQEALRRYYPELLGAAPTAPTAPTPVNAMAPTAASAAAPLTAAPAPVAAPLTAAPTANALAPAPTTAAPTNAMIAPAGGKTVDQLRREILLFGQFDTPQAKAMVDTLKGQVAELTKTHTVSPGAQVVSGGRVVYAAPTELGNLEREITDLRAAGVADSDPRIVARRNKITKLTTHQPGTTVNLPPQEKAFEQELGKGQAERVIKSKTAAEDAAQILQTNQIGRDILKSGAITGTGADFFVGFNNALKQAGIDFGYADAAANSQAYAAAMGANVGRIIKQFGAGTGLSDDDRKFAEQMAGGKISLTDTALRRILDINDRAANNVIDKHNKDVKGIKTNVPLTVEKPTFEQPKPPASGQIPGQSRAPAAAIPQAAIDDLKAGKGTDAQFDAIFGPGAAKRARGQ